MLKKLLAFSLAAVIGIWALSGCVSVSVNDPTVGEDATVPVADDAPSEVYDSTNAAETIAPAREVSVRPAEWTSVQWQPYSCAYFTLYVPVGWQVNWDGNAQKLWWTVTNPEGDVGIYNLDHDYAAKDPAMTQTLGFNKPLNDASVQGYFEMLYEDTTDHFTVQNSITPENYSVLQSSTNKKIWDYKSLYATFKDSTVGEGEGIYSAVMFDHDDIVIRGANYANWEIDAILTQWAPLGQFVNWKDVLAQIAQSFAYTDYYVQEWHGWLNTSVNPSPSTSDTDPVMQAFEERSKSDTIIQEKRSDMIGEYERVYDNETGDIYRAYNGFLDDMGDQKRYSPITDNQYADGYVGWIDKD